MTANNQVNVGGRTVGGVAAGVAATDAVNVAQLNAATAGLNSAIDGLTTDVGTLFDLRRSDRQEMRKGIAAAIAMPDAPMPTEQSRAEPVHAPGADRAKPRCQARPPGPRRAGPS